MGCWDEISPGKIKRSVLSAKLGFDAIPTERELKARWKQIAKTAHPDVGGDEDYFVAMKSSFDEAEMLIKEATP